MFDRGFTRGHMKPVIRDMCRAASMAPSGSLSQRPDEVQVAFRGDRVVSENGSTASLRRQKLKLHLQLFLSFNAKELSQEPHLFVIADNNCYGRNVFSRTNSGEHIAVTLKKTNLEGA